MITALTRPGRTLAKQLLMIEFGVVIFLAALATLIADVNWGISAFIGGNIFVISNAVFAFFAFLFSGARSAKRITHSFYAGEALKILVTVVLFSVAYVYMQVELIPLKITYLLVLSFNIFAPALFINNKK